MLCRGAILICSCAGMCVEQTNGAAVEFGANGDAKLYYSDGDIRSDGPITFTNSLRLGPFGVDVLGAIAALQGMSLCLCVFVAWR